MKFRSTVFFAAVIVSIFSSLIAFAQSSSVAELEKILAAEEARGAALVERIERLEAARLQSVVITNPDAKKFAALSFVVRLRIKDAIGTNYGTGSVIFSEEGRAIILTVSHIFRKMDKKSVIIAELFNPTTGKIEVFSIGYNGIKATDMDADVGLLEIRPDRIIKTVPLISPDDVLKVGQKVVSYGCGGGDAPTSLWHTITMFNRYTGPDNIECTGVPIQGRSGGALVNEAGELIGITIAADHRDQRGLYGGMRPINALLEKIGLNPKDLQKP